MVSENVDETKPASKKTYFASKSIMKAYDTLFMRGSDAIEQKVMFEAWDYAFLGRLRLLCAALVRPFKLQLERRARRAPAMGLNDTKAVKESAGVPTTADRTDELPF